MAQTEQAVVSQINENTFRFTETAFGTDVYMYLLVGRDKALLIDTGYGFTDLPAAVRKITLLPLIVVNTHGHMDHIHGNYMFPEVQISGVDAEVFSRHMDPGYLRNLMLEVLRANSLPEELMDDPTMKIDRVLDCRPCVTRPLPAEMYYELGERKVTILKTPGHTQGSISLLDEKNSWLFAADTCCRDGVLLHFPESTSVERFLRTVKMLQKLAADGRIHRIYPGHQVTPLEPSVLDLYERNTLAVLNGEVTQKEHDSDLYTADALTIRFNPQNIYDH